MKKYNQTPFIYPDYIVQVLNQLMASGVQNKSNILNKRADIVNILYNQFNNFPITEQVYTMMWGWINRMLAAGHGEWIKQYWGTANQYCTFKLEYSPKGSSKENFCEFHIMVCVLLFYKERYDILRHSLTFTNSLPARFPLIPSSFAQIFHVYENLSEKNQHMYLLKYHMFGSYEGAGEENKIEGLLIDYLALLMIRLYGVNDYNITFSDPLGLPVMGKTIEENGYKIDMANILRSHLEKISNDKIRACDLNPEWKEKAHELIQEYINGCKQQIQSLNENYDVSKEKSAYIKDDLKAAVSDHAPHLPTLGAEEQKKQKNGDLEFTASQTIELDERLILDNHSSISSNLGEALINSLNSQIEQFYCYQFLLNSAIKTFVIPYRDFSKALKRLSLSSEYAILAMGVPSYFFDETEGFTRGADYTISYDKSPVYCIPSNNEVSILIMKEKDIPRYAFRKLTEGLNIDEKEIESKNHLFSNIDEIAKDKLVLTVKQGYVIQMPSPLRYIRLRIAYQLESDNMLTTKVQSIKNYI